MVWDLIGLLVLRVWLLVASGWGLMVMWRLRRRAKEIEFPIVPPSLVKLTAMFLTACFLSTLWITFHLFFGDAAWNASSPVGALTAWERMVYGTSLVYALSCCLWIINVGTKGYRRGPKVDEVVLDAIVEGMSWNPSIDIQGEVDG